MSHAVLSLLSRVHDFVRDDLVAASDMSLGIYIFGVNRPLLSLTISVLKILKSEEHGTNLRKRDNDVEDDAGHESSVIIIPHLRQILLFKHVGTCVDGLSVGDILL